MMIFIWKISNVLAFYFNYFVRLVLFCEKQRSRRLQLAASSTAITNGVSNAIGIETRSLTDLIYVSFKWNVFIIRLTIYYPLSISIDISKEKEKTRFFRVISWWIQNYIAYSNTNQQINMKARKKWCWTNRFMCKISFDDILNAWKKWTYLLIAWLVQCS